jgi:hypothetical protein
MYRSRNPIYAKLVKPRRNLREYIWLTTAFSALTTGYYVFAYITRSTGTEVFAVLVTTCCTMGTCITIVSPWTVVLVAVEIIVKDIRSESFDLICVTPLSNAEILHGYLFAALHRVRGYLTLLINWLPFLIVMFLGTLDRRVTRERSSAQWLIIGFMMLGILIGLCGISFFAACLAICFGVWFRDRILATILAMGICLFVLTIYFALFITLMTSSSPVSEIINFQNILYVVALMLLPYLGGFGLLFIASFIIRNRQLGAIKTG